VPLIRLRHLLPAAAGRRLSKEARLESLHLSVEGRRCPKGRVVLAQSTVRAVHIAPLAVVLMV